MALSHDDSTIHIIVVIIIILLRPTSTKRQARELEVK